MKTGNLAMVDLTRRSVLAAAGALPLAVLAPSFIEAALADVKAGAGFRFFNAHQAAVIEEASARLVPGPQDDPFEMLANSPGAREAHVVRYIDTMLSAFDYSPPRIFAGGPWSNRHPLKGRANEDYLADFVPLVERQLVGWKKRIKDLQHQYVEAIKVLDAQAGGDFSKATTSKQDQILTQQAAVRQLIFGHTVEGMYSVPEYGGNADRAGWESIKWPGDAQPRGYTAAEVENSDGVDLLDPTGVVKAMLEVLPVAAREMRAQGWRLV